ncbi:hotdog fold thioesterase [Aliikangiella coralliicola]|uniref:Hotdog fold thioesterase n=1 Tax=Aliikangiella coralliicola TaxID=2592383 RepID=A0A545U4N3_9GAMM|nr:hotdog fold thioesterase [Aliikangiella coralliicola]TQV84440.1 hotdog fold thioesterase [Aliikangiella coralliicola]
MTIWKKQVSVEELNQERKKTMVSHLGIEVTEIGEDYLVASMPVDERTHQPMGILHGGASIALAETVGSLAANLAVDENHYCVGLEVNSNHLRSIRSGTVLAKASAVHLGRSTQVWDIRISDQADNKICISRLTMAVLKR